MLTKDESAVLLNFLDRVEIKGHQERQNMNILVEKIVDVGRKSAVTTMPKIEEPDMEVDDASNT